MFEPKDTYDIYLSSGHTITLTGVSNFKLGHNKETGKYIEYSITWHKPEYKPKFISFNLNEIVAVVCREKVS